MANRRKRSLRGRCKVQHKGSFSSYRAAERVAHRARETGRVYWHAECGMYHITRQSRQENEQRHQRQLNPPTAKDSMDRFNITTTVEAARWLPDVEDIRTRVLSWVIGAAASAGYDVGTGTLTVYNTDQTVEKVESGNWIVYFNDPDDDDPPTFAVADHDMFMKRTTPMTTQGNDAP